MAPRDAVVVHAPLDRDPELIVRVIAQAGVQASAVFWLAELLETVTQGDAGALMLTVEALSSRSVEELSEVLSHQEHPSDLPVLILVPEDGNRPP